MKLFFDNIIFSLQKAGGISTYWGELSSRLIRDNIDVTFIENNLTDNLVRNSYTTEPLQISSDHSFPKIVNRFLPFKLAQLKERFIFHSSYNRVTTNAKALQVITVHDFVHELFYSGFRRKLHSFQKKRAIDIAHAIICVSENTKSDLLRINPNVDPNKVKVIYNGVSEDFYPIETDTRNIKPYLVFIGSREHYKNFDFVVKLLNQMEDFDLVIVGKPLNKQEMIFTTSQLGGRFRVYSHINNVELNKIYNSAYALLYPSSYEGFGIPLLEAMKTGLPFIGLNKSSIPEVSGDAGILLEHLDIDAFKNAIFNIETNRNILIKKGLSQASKFSWEKCYQQTVEVYKQLY
jgi:glycosyltransferase involved in cell wall biosynthesis